MKETLIQCLRAAGGILLEHFGRIREVSRKESHSHIVTEADLASEHCIIEHIRLRFPDHSIIAEESGFQRRSSPFTWIVDPLDGTSNFAAGLPWFGILLAVLEHNQPVLAGMYFPESDQLYHAEKGRGVYRDSQRIHVSTEPDLSNVLCAFSLDSDPDADRTRRNILLATQLVNRTRNVRSTNCLVDFAYALDGRFGACLNGSTRIWDIAPACLMFPEAGGILTDWAGRPIDLTPTPSLLDRNFSVVGSTPALHPTLLEIIRQSGAPR